ncbi:MAG: flagellar protein FliT [Candidatus Sericytochromatia bacterium]|uniref:Flagellar protein FliT n=1 Tax=Candidatus Tanganyikabacteria bacterium TaxID=2961651 RepID=A0A937X1I3_9BACT|nr:flagellar protein FliT [Candidatus Tanganyikabacteria bacterium]
MSEDLARIYREALDLTIRQGAAIREDRWDDLLALLDKREHCLDAAEALLYDQPNPANQLELAGILGQVHDVDAANQNLFSEKREALAAELSEVNQVREALTGYMSSLRGDNFDPSFVDRSS